MFWKHLPFVFAASSEDIEIAQIIFNKMPSNPSVEHVTSDIRQHAFHAQYRPHLRTCGVADSAASQAFLGDITPTV